MRVAAMLEQTGLMMSPVTPLRCLIVDDSPAFLTAARDLLEQQGVMVVAVSSTSADAMRRAEELRPDVALVDIDLAGESGFDLAERLHQLHRSPPVILISTHAQQDFADMIAASPAAGFLSKSALSSGAIRALLYGGDAGAGQVRASRGR